MKTATFDEFAAEISKYNSAIHASDTPKAHRAEVQIRGMFIDMRNQRDDLLSALEEIRAHVEAMPHQNPTCTAEVCSCWRLILLEEIDTATNSN